MEFKQWLFETSGGFELTIDPSITSFALKKKGGKDVVEIDPKKLKIFVKRALNDYFRNNLEGAAARYAFHLESIDDRYDIRFRFRVVPKGGIPEKTHPDRTTYDLDMKYNKGLTGWKVHKSPKEAIEEIPNDPNLAYRGMSWEEWQFIRSKGYIKSHGGYNIGQDGLTFYGDAQTAAYYGSGFAPMAYTVSKKRPSVVIAVPRNKVMSSKDHSDIPQSEFAHDGPLDAKEIVKAWILTPTRSYAGKLELIFNWVPERSDGEYTGNYVLGKPSEGARLSPNVEYAIRELI